MDEAEEDFYFEVDLDKENKCTDKKQKRIKQIWQVQEILQLPELQSRTDFIKVELTKFSEVGWTKGQTYSASSGTEVVEQFKCALGHRLGCPALAKAVTNQLSGEVTLSTANEHEHDIFADKCKVPVAAREFIAKEMSARPVKPLELSRQLQEHNLPLLQLGAIRNLVARGKSKVVGEDQTKASYGSIQAWADDNMLKDLLLEPESTEHTPGVILCETKSEEGKVLVVTTTKHLLSNLVKSASSLMQGFIAVDGTYQIVSQNMPLLAIGTVDMNRKYHIVAFALANGETKEAIFESMQAVKSATSVILAEPVSSLKYGMSDNVPHVRAALEEVFPGLKPLNCYSHLAVMAFTPGSGGLWKKTANKDNVEGVQSFVSSLHNLTDPDVLDAAHKVMHRELVRSMKEPALSAHFDSVYGQGTARNWAYACVDPGVPLSNNATERANRDFKDNGTNHQRPNINHLVCNVMPQYLRQRSVEDKDFALAPEVPTSEWRSAVEFKDSEQYAARIRRGEALCIPSSDTMARLGGTPTRAAIKETFKAYDKLHKDPHAAMSVYKRLNHYIEDACSFYELSPMPDALTTPFIVFKCTCPAFWDYRRCKHVLGHALALQLIQIPRAKDPAIIGAKAKRGRPKKV